MPRGVVAVSRARSLTRARQDTILLTMVPPDISKSPFDELRCIVPIRLATDPWTHDGATFEPSEYSSPSSDDDAASQRLANYRASEP